jgi:hypothetical protein
MLFVMAYRCCLVKGFVWKFFRHCLCEDESGEWSARMVLESSGKEQVYSSTRGWEYSSCISAVDRDAGVTLI